MNEALPNTQEELKALFHSFIEASRTMEEQHKRLTEEVIVLRQSNASKDRQLQRKSRLESLGQMAAGVAHEIRNPLGGIQLYTDLLMRRLESQNLEVETNTIKKIKSHIVQLDQIVSDMLGFTKEVVMRPRPTEIQEALARALELAQGHPSRSQHQVDFSAEAATLCVDGDQLQRVFLNIILNAYQAMESFGKLEIRGSYLRESSLYKITFSDEGPGIPEGKLEEIFNPFVTTKGEGTGLGLAIAHRVLEEHEGCIEIRNNYDRGATVTVTLPLEGAGTSHKDQAA